MCALAEGHGGVRGEGLGRALALVGVEDRAWGALGVVLPPALAVAEDTRLLWFWVGSIVQGPTLVHFSTQPEPFLSLPHLGGRQACACHGCKSDRGENGA
jgi:hypothetical protein